MDLYTGIFTFFALILLTSCTLFYCSLCDHHDDEEDHPDRIADLPGQPEAYTYRQYSGYLATSNGSSLFYWFVESQHSASDDPLAVWYTGGPGCSSLVALLDENGPFKVSKDGESLTLNPYSWNSRVNMLYVDSPSGVGYSYDARNHSTGDTETAVNNLLALKSFFRKHPSFSSNAFFITGESYAGVYIPMLTVLLLEHSHINLKGIIIGNGYMDARENSNSLIYFAYYHGLWDARDQQDLIDKCCHGNHYDCDFYSSVDLLCYKKLLWVKILLSEQNIYNIYEKCYNDKRSHLATRSYIFPFIKDKREVLIGCEGHQSYFTWLNKPEVRSALHVTSAAGTWQVVSDYASLHYKTEYTSMAPFIKDIVNSGIKVMLYNGDIDMACNFLGDEKFVDDLGLEMTTGRQLWYYTDEDDYRQIGGFVKLYDNLQFRTVQGSGHMVPTDKPLAAIHMFQEFIKWSL